MFFARKSNSEEASDNVDIVYIIEPSEGSGIWAGVSEKLVRILGERAVPAQRIQWPPEPSRLKGKTLISLLELAKPLLADISPVDFDTLKAIILQSSRLLWVAMGDDPVGQTAIGYLRVLQNENPNLDLRYLLLENEPHHEPSDVVNTVTKVALMPTTDREYIEMNGNLCINRWVADDGLSRLNASGNDTGIIEYIAVEEARTGLELVDSRPSFYFDIDHEVKEELASEDVEIGVKALGIK